MKSFRAMANGAVGVLYGLLFHYIGHLTSLNIGCTLSVHLVEKFFIILLYLESKYCGIVSYDPTFIILYMRYALARGL